MNSYGVRLLGSSTSAEVIGRDEIGEMLSSLLVAVVLEALDGGVLDRAVHARHLAMTQECLGSVVRCSISPS